VELESIAPQKFTAAVVVVVVWVQWPQCRPCHQCWTPCHFVASRASGPRSSACSASSAL